MFKEASLTAAFVQEERFIDSESEDKCFRSRDYSDVNPD